MCEPLQKRLKAEDGGQENTPAEALIHNLPTELLEVIFSNVCVQDLIYNVSRVCRRWREALYSAPPWKAKELNYCSVREDAFVFALEAASSLRKITLTPIACEHPGRVVDALLSSSTYVREFHYYLSLFSVVTGARILRHIKDCVEVLHLEGDVDRQSGLQRNLSPVLAQMSQLRVLKLSGYFDTKWDVDILKQGCRNLVHLDVSEMHDESDSYRPLLDSVKSSLKVLRLPQFRCNVGVHTMVSACTDLIEITLCVDDIRCILNMYELKSLHIKWSDTPHTSTRVNKFIRECTVFENLVELTLHYLPGSVALAIAKRCSHLQSLTMNGITSCPDIIKVIPTVKRLCVKDRLTLRMRNLQQIPQHLPYLKYLDVRGCFMERGIPPKIVTQLRSALPGLTLLSDHFSCYKRHGNKLQFKKSTDLSTDCSSDECNK